MAKMNANPRKKNRLNWEREREKKTVNKLCMRTVLHKTGSCGKITIKC